MKGFRSHGSKEYVPNHIPLETQVGYLAASVLLIAYAVYAVSADDFLIWIPGRRGDLTIHLHGPSVWIAVGAIVMATLCMLSVVMDHFDERPNEATYRVIAKAALIGAAALMVSAIMLDAFFFQASEYVSVRDSINGERVSRFGVTKADMRVAKSSAAIERAQSTWERAMAYNNRGIAYSESNKYDLAIADYSKVIELAPGFVYGHANRAVDLCRKGDCVRAISDFDAALKIDPSHSYALYGRGVARIRVGDREGGQRDVTEAVRLDRLVAKTFRSLNLVP